MTSRMEFRNYRSSAQLVHCNIHQKRYSDVPGKYRVPASKPEMSFSCTNCSKGLLYFWQTENEIFNVAVCFVTECFEYSWNNVLSIVYNCIHRVFYIQEISIREKLCVHYSSGRYWKESAYAIPCTVPD